MVREAADGGNAALRCAASCLSVNCHSRQSDHVYV